MPCDTTTLTMLTNVEDELAMMDRHLTILRQVFEDAPIGIVSISNETGHPRHKVRYSLRVLEENELIEPTDRGAVVTDQAAAFVDSSPERIDEIISSLERLKTETAAVEASSKTPIQ